MARRPDSLASSCQSNVPIWCSDFIDESVEGRSRCCEGQAKCVGLSIVALFESHFVVSFIFALLSPAGREMSPDNAHALIRIHSCLFIHVFSFMPFYCACLLLNRACVVHCVRGM